MGRLAWPAKCRPSRLRGEPSRRVPVARGRRSSRRSKRSSGASSARVRARWSSSFIGRCRPVRRGSQRRITVPRIRVRDQANRGRISSPSTRGWSGAPVPAGEAASAIRRPAPVAAQPGPPLRRWRGRRGRGSGRRPRRASGGAASCRGSPPRFRRGRGCSEFAAAGGSPDGFEPPAEAFAVSHGQVEVFRLHSASLGIDVRYALEERRFDLRAPIPHDPAIERRLGEEIHIGGAAMSPLPREHGTSPDAVPLRGRNSFRTGSTVAGSCLGPLGRSIRMGPLPATVIGECRC